MMTRRQAREYRARLESVAQHVPADEVDSVATFFHRWCSGEEYAVGHRVQDGGVVYECLQGHTSQADWMPSVTPALWKVVRGTTTDDDGNVTVEEYPEWVQPTGAHDAYAIGAKVSHNGKHWVSECDGNVWEPSVYGWTEIVV